MGGGAPALPPALPVNTRTPASAAARVASLAAVPSVITGPQAEALPPVAPAHRRTGRVTIGQHRNAPAAPIRATASASAASLRHRLLRRVNFCVARRCAARVRRVPPRQATPSTPAQHRLYSSAHSTQHMRPGCRTTRPRAPRIFPRQPHRHRRMALHRRCTGPHAQPRTASLGG